MTAAISEACIGWLHENCYFVREFFLFGKWALFLLMVRVLPPSTGFPPNGRFGEGVGAILLSICGQYQLSIQTHFYQYVVYNYGRNWVRHKG